MKTYGRNPEIFEFLRENFPKLAKILRFYSKFWRITLKNVKMLLKNFVFFNKVYTFYTKNLFIRPKYCVQIIFYNERCKKFRKNQFFSNIFTFLSVTRQNFEYNLRT